MRTQERDALERLVAHSSDRERLMALDAARKGCSETESNRLRDELVRTRQLLASERLAHQTRMAAMQTELTKTRHEGQRLSDMIEEAVHCRLGAIHALRVRYEAWKALTR